MRDEAAPDGVSPQSDLDPDDGVAVADDDSDLNDLDLVTRLQQENASLHLALSSNRFIGAAVGIIMITKFLTYEAAFDHLRALSQRSNRKIRDLADEIVMTGAVPRTPGD